MVMKSQRKKQTQKHWCYCGQDSNGNPFVSNEQKIGLDSLRCRPKNIFKTFAFRTGKNPTFAPHFR